MKRAFFFALLSVFVLAFYAWAGDAVEDEIKAKTKPVVQRFFDALKVKNYEGLRQDFSDEMLKALPSKELENTDKADFAKSGELVSWEYSGCMREDGFDIVMVGIQRANGDKSQYKFVFKAGPEGKKIAGLWLKPLPKDPTKAQTENYLNWFGAIAEDHLKAVKAKDYVKATKDFSPEMLAALGPEAFKKTVETQETPKFGELVSWKFAHAREKGEFVVLHYQADYSKGVTLSYQVVFRRDGTDKRIQGLWLKPLGAE